MNIITKMNKAEEKLRALFQRAYFTFIQKPLYQLSYNSHGNSFVCHGRLYHLRIILTGTDCQIVIGGGGCTEEHNHQSVRE